MPYVHMTTREIYFKIVYYGPGLCGKTTNLEHIHARTPAARRGNLISLKTESERTLFFDFMPFELGVIGGLKARLSLYTVPGQVFYRASRKLILNGVDGIVFVADSQRERAEANLEAMIDLRENLAEHGMALERLPHVLQYNKRDLDRIEPVEVLRAQLNTAGAPDIESDARSGRGVVETLRAVTRLLLRRLEPTPSRALRRPPPTSVPA